MRIIAHADMDAFFASVEERDKPWLRGLPVVIGCDPEDGRGRGVVSTANYKARAYGIKSALPIQKAWQFSEAAKKKGLPGAIFLGTNFSRYEAVSQDIVLIFKKFSKHVEQASIDEAYLDISSCKNFKEAKKLCWDIQSEIAGKLQLSVSIGIGPNKLIAKIASDMQKPEGLTVVNPEDVKSFLAPLPIKKIPGIGPKTEIILNKKGIRLIGDLQNIPLKTMQEWLGKWGIDLYYKSQGINDSPVVEHYENKSIGHQETFHDDTIDAPIIIESLVKMSDDVFQEFSKSVFKTFKTITITVRFADFVTKTRSITLKEPSNNKQLLQTNTLKMILPFLDARENPDKKSIRLVGVRIEKLQ